MAGITFSHPNPALPTLALRLAPTEVDWSYNLITSETNTYAGQVVQVLGVNFENLVIVGRFGKEGRSDYSRVKNAWIRNSAPGLAATSKYGPGLTQMTEWFKRYFALASQGLPNGDNYSESPVTVTYQGTYDSPIDIDKVETSWKVYPVSFPSYKIANDNFAPEWRVECQVYEAPAALTAQTMDAAISRLSYQPLYQPGSVFSDPEPEFTGPGATRAQLQKAAKAALAASQAQADIFTSLLPAYTESDIASLLQRGFSAPASNSTNKAQQIKKQTTLSGDPFSDPNIIGGASNPIFNGQIP